jgi:hypothetical protein
LQDVKKISSILSFCAKSSEDLKQNRGIPGIFVLKKEIFLQKILEDRESALQFLFCFQIPAFVS